MTNARMIFGLCAVMAACGDDDSSPDQTEEQNPSTAGDRDADTTPNSSDASAPTADAGAGPRDASATQVDAGERRDAGLTPAADAGDDDAGGPQTDASTSAGPTFSQVYPLLASNCSPCHTTENQGGLDMSSRLLAYQNLVAQNAGGPMCRGAGRVRVVPENAPASLLVQKLEGTQDCGSRMPRGRAPLPASSIALIKAWIEAGAPND